VDETTTILVELQAQATAVFWPYRHGRATSMTAVEERRRAFYDTGVIWHPADSSEAGRKAAWRLVGDLVRARLVERFKSPTDRTLSLRLTAATDRWVLGLIGLPESFEAVPGHLKKLLSLEGHDDAGGGEHAGWIPETLMAGVAYGSEGIQEALVLEGMLATLPLRLGTVEFNSDGQGRGYYRLTPAGRRIATGEVAFDYPRTDLPEKSLEASEHHHRTFDAAFQAIRRAVPERSGELGSIPLTCSLATNRVVREFAERRATG
jgi:hypothetical protein